MTKSPSTVAHERGSRTTRCLGVIWWAPVAARPRLLAAANARAAAAQRAPFARTVAARCPPQRLNALYVRARARACVCVCVCVVWLRVCLATHRSRTVWCLCHQRPSWKAADGVSRVFSTPAYNRPQTAHGTCTLYPSRLAALGVDRSASRMCARLCRTSASRAHGHVRSTVVPGDACREAPVETGAAAQSPVLHPSPQRATACAAHAGGSDGGLLLL